MKMQQPSLIKSSLLMLGLLSFGAMAQTEFCPKEFDVLIMEKKDFDFKARELPNLYCTKKFEGKHFKIVEGTSDDAITFNADPEVIRRAANVYYHLNIARGFWANSINSAYVQNMDQMTVRINITNSYSRTRQFKNAAQEENYNNAWSTPEGQTPRFIKDKKVWGKEIWFSPKKIVESRKEVKTEGKNPVHQSIELVKEPLWGTTQNSLIYQGLALTQSAEAFNTDFMSSAITNVGLLAVMYTASEVTKGMDKLFVNKYYYVDTAMVPEIIYHEFAHIALSDTMKTVHSVPVIEGMADYFAARIQTDDNTLYSHIKGYSSNRTKKLKNKKLYHPFLEQGWNAESDFVLSLLWNARLNFSFANEERVRKGQREMVDFDQLVFQAHFNLNEESDIMNDLTSSLLEACSVECSSKRKGMDILHKSFEGKGLN